VPNAAIQNINNQQVVFLATGEPNVFILRPVWLGVESKGFLPVQEGLHVGDRVVTTGSFLLRAEWLKTHPGQ
jgi:cobalt-zinc-cadmium efflux system membrane fusion protein